VTGVSFEKAKQLLRLATMTSGRVVGVTLSDIEEEFSVNRRTAQRMLDALKDVFDDLTSEVHEDRRKRWRLPQGKLRDLLTLEPEEIAALDVAIAVFSGTPRADEAAQLTTLRDKVMALVPRATAVRLAPDHETLLEAQGLAARPGPRPRVDPKVSATIGEAIKGCQALEIRYRSWQDDGPRWRRVHPYGVLTGIRRYLVARPAESPDGRMRLYRAADIHAARLLADAFERDQDFSLQAFANRAFGVFQTEAEYGEVVWRFRPEAAERARAFVFHPEQTTEDGPDGALTVRFRAAGHLEMCWYLYSWGDAVEVLAPDALRRMVENHRRSDFQSLP